MRDDTDYYVILQVDPRAEPEIIEAAYRRLAAKYHPDHNPSPEANHRMKLINAAYQVISNPERRRNYDLDRGHISNWPRSGPRVGRRKSNPWWPVAVILGFAAVAVLSRSPMLILALVVIIFVFLYWWLGRPHEG